MNRGDYLTHLGLALVFFGVLAPFLIKEGLDLGAQLYLVGTTAQVATASAARLFSGRE